MNKSKNMKKPNKKSSKTQDVEVIRIGEGKFFYPKGDSYEGQYMVINKKEIYRHGKCIITHQSDIFFFFICIKSFVTIGYGVYKTHDEDEYHAIWDKDNIGTNFHVM